MNCCLLLVLKNSIKRLNNECFLAKYTGSWKLFPLIAMLKTSSFKSYRNKNTRISRNLLKKKK